MANLLSITKEDNDQFSFILNGDSSTEIINTRNDLLTVGDFVHFKTSNGANLIKQQNVIYSNVSLFNGVTPVSAPTSVRDLFDKLTALDFFEWMKGTGGGGVDRFTDLVDTFPSYLGKAGQFIVVSGDELQLETIEFNPVTKFTELSDAPDVILAGKYLKGSADSTTLEFADSLLPDVVEPLFIDENGFQIQQASASTDGYLRAEDYVTFSEGLSGLQMFDYPRLLAPQTDFELPLGEIAVEARVNYSSIYLPETSNLTGELNQFVQTGTTVVFNQELQIGNYVAIFYKTI